jgi:hypothetical protein
MATNSTRWSLVVSSAIDKSLREFLASEGRARKGELSRFVEEAVRKQIFDMTIEAARQRNKTGAAETIDAEVDEALAWARTKRL